MRAVAAALLAALLLAGAAAAQFTERAPAVPVPGPGFKPGGGVSISLGIPTANGQAMVRPFLVVGADNTVNATIYNFDSVYVNDTLVLNATVEGRVVDRIPISVAPGEQREFSFTFHPEDVGVYLLRAQLESLKQQDGSPILAQFDVFAAPAVAVKIVDPPALGTTREDNEYQSINGGPFSRGLLVRTRPEEAVTFRVEVTNLRDVALGAFDLSLRTTEGEPVGTIEIPTIDALASQTFEFPEWAPGADPRFVGCSGCQFGFEFLAKYRAAGGTAEIAVGDYRLENGAVVEIVPATGVVEVQESLVADVLVPKSMRLGVPARIKVNVTNFGTDVVRAASVRVTLSTPNNLHYGVQGPEVRDLSVRGLSPGDHESSTFEFTPRVTGTWSVYSLVSERSTRFGGGGLGFLVEGPISIASADSGTLIGRIREPVVVEVAVRSTALLDNAELRIVAQSQQGYFGDPSSGETALTPGIAQRVVRSDPERIPLGTLRAGDVVNATFTLVSSGSGVYQVSPFVVAGGFAYTSTSQSSSNVRGGEVVQDPFYYGGGPAFIQLAIQPRPVSVSWALFPFTVIVAITVGAWTLRTRFVR